MSSPSASVVVVDDEPLARRFVTQVLQLAGHRCVEAAGVDEAIARIDAAPPELVVTDLVMPGGSGLSLVRQLRERHPDVAAVMLTASDDPETIGRALDGGVYGYVVKPFSAKQLEIAVESALTRRRLAAEGRAQRERLEQLVSRRTIELQRSQEETIERLARAVDSRDAGTGEHLQRMSDLARRVALELGWCEADAEMLRLASVLHDVGKVGVPDEILLKQGPLGPNERGVMEGHAAAGHAILAGARSDLLRLADSIAWTHHERYDGSGYPRHLAGEDIPMAGRIAAVADVYDALISDRPYRPAYSTAEAVELIRAGRSAAFDPQVVDALLRVVA